MAVVRTHRYTVDAAKLKTMLDQRATVIQGIRSANSALTNARLVRLDDGTYLDVWTWESADAMHAVAEAAKNFPLVGATFAMLEDHVIVDVTSSTNASWTTPARRVQTDRSGIEKHHWQGRT